MQGSHEDLALIVRRSARSDRYVCAYGVLCGEAPLTILR